MKMFALAMAAATFALGAPAQAVEHSTTIVHPVGPIAADYAGMSRVAMDQVGAVGVGGRQDTLRCRWTVSLDVERRARLASGHEARRTLARSDVAKGSLPGWCPKRGDGTERILARHRAELNAALMAMVEQDRAVILAEADNMQGTPRES